MCVACCVEDYVQPIIVFGLASSCLAFQKHERNAICDMQVNVTLMFLYVDSSTVLSSCSCCYLSATFALGTRFGQKASYSEFQF